MYDANFAWADLRQADLRKISLIGANWFQADLRGAKVTPEQKEYARAHGAICDAD